MMNLRSLLLGLAAVLAAAPAATQSQTPDRLQRILDRGVLRVRLDGHADVQHAVIPRPESFTASTSTRWRPWAPTLGVKIEYVKMTFSSMLADLAADKFDIAMSGLGRTMERARIATFSKPYLRYGRLLMIRSADKARFKTLADLDQPGIRIAYNHGGLNDQFANTMFKRATPVGFESNAAATAELLAGKVDAQVSNSNAVIYMSRQNPRLAAVSPEKLFEPDYVAILLGRDDQTLLNFINIWIDKIEVNGTLGQIRAKWLGDTK